MAGRHTSWNDIRGPGLLIAVAMAAVASLGTWAFHANLTAKAPGETNCYKDVCHRVYTLDETRRLIGQSVELTSTHYDVPGVDKFNTGELTSSGERFDANNPGRTSASNYPDGTELLVWNPVTKRAAHVRVNDFGPFWGKRTLDVTRRVAEDLGFAKSGVAPLRVTVIWVPSTQAARYKKERSYPLSLGLVGVVEPEQYDALVASLVASADARNRELLPLPAAPPDFNSEAVVAAIETAANLELRLADLSADVPIVNLGPMPVELVRPVYAGVSALRSEAAADAVRVARDVDAAVLVALARVPVPISDATMPAELSPPAVVAAVAPRRAAEALPGETRVATAGPTPANRSTVANGSLADATEQAGSSGVSAPAGHVPERDVAGVSAAGSGPRVSVALSRRDLGFGTGAFSLWIGIALMLSTLLGAAGFARRRKVAGAQVLPRDIDRSMAGYDVADPLAVARRAAALAEADARAVLAREMTSRHVTSEAEAEAREVLAREIARREVEREAAMRAQLESAAAAHASAARELEEIQTARRDRAAQRPLPGSLPASVVAPPPSRPAPIRIEPPRKVAADLLPPATFPGISDEKLAAAILGRPGSEKYWGNTIIKQANLVGTVRSGSPLRVDGVIEGACYAPVIFVSEGATVMGVIAAETIIVLGSVGGILAGRNITVAKTALVEGEVFYQTLSIDPQAQCDVQFTRLGKTDDPVTLGAAVYEARLSTSQDRAA